MKCLGVTKCSEPGGFKAAEALTAGDQSKVPPSPPKDITPAVWKTLAQPLAAGGWCGKVVALVPGACSSSIWTR